MNILRKVTSIAAAAVMAASLAACGSSSSSSTGTASSAAAASETAAAAASTGTSYHVGICQLVQHPALDQATQGFKDALTDEFGDSVTFDEQNAAGDAATATTICQNLVAEKVDLILANATASLQSAAAATTTIPVLGTAITDYGTALDTEVKDGVIGTNISGTSDLAPLDQQADMITELVPSAQKLGILYCSAEPNSKFQADQIRTYAEANGLTVTDYTFSDSNDVTSVTNQACSDSDVIYIPTDNTAASCTEAINNVALAAKVPIIAGEEGIMSGCGIATLTISYYNLGVTTGKMAAQILKGEADVSTMAIQYDQDTVKEYNPEICDALGITVPDDYTAYAAQSSTSEAS